MRTKQKHICWGCANKTESFLRIKRKVNLVKRYQCNPPCSSMMIIEHFQNKIMEEVMPTLYKHLDDLTMNGEAVTFFRHKS